MLFFDGISALYGGIAFISDPTGGFIKMPLELLKNTPFRDYLIPGIVLLVFNGISSIVISVLTMLSIKNYQWLIIFQGIVLTIWLTVQIFMIKMFSPLLHITCYITGLLMIITGSILIRIEKE